MHNRVHVWVGGSMNPGSSPNDPVFFLHHCFVDKLWADWQKLHPGAGYLPISGAAAGHNLNDSMQPWASLGEIVKPSGMLDHHALGYAYDTEPECAATLKFSDDIKTLKFNDDTTTLKFADDNPPTLKFNDDLGTLKFLEDNPPTLKFNDDGTLKFADDKPPTLKFNDDGGTLKFADDLTTNKRVDDVKNKFVDDPLQKPAGDLNQMPSARNSAAPFILATPHHSMAWAQSYPQALQAALAEYETRLTQLADVLAQGDEAFQRGALSESDLQQLHALNREFEALKAEYQELTRQATGR